MKDISDFNNQYFLFYRGMYIFHQKYFDADKDCIKQIQIELTQKYKTQFAADIISAVYDEIVRVNHLMNSEYFKETYYSLYGNIHKFHKKHAGAKTYEHWKVLAEDVKQFDSSQFSHDLCAAVVNKIDRTYKK